MTLSSIFFILELESIYIPPVFLVQEGIGWGLDLMEVFLEDKNNVSVTQIPSKTSVSEPTHSSAIWRSSEELDDLIQGRHLQQIVDSRQSDIKLSRFHMMMNSESDTDLL